MPADSPAALTPLGMLLELDGPVDPLLRVAAFLRHDAMMQRTAVGHRWDIPETMAKAYENAATLLEQEANQAAKRNEYARLQTRAALLVHLVGCVIEALEAYDSDDGHNELVLAGITAEFRRIEAEYEGGGEDA